ncbi:MAG TPA: HD domain-containing phosphohydrolase [Chloroflexota bacterium]|nr:HD domain-containing phosphohydrolase [Chloroflexota bacterium]
MARTKILLADDQAQIRHLVAATLGTQQWELLYASDGEEALRVAREQQPDIILLDVSMPKLDGFEVCRQLKADPATQHIAIVMLTGMRDPESRDKASQAGADEYFVKPFGPLALLSKLEELRLHPSASVAAALRTAPSAGMFIPPPQPPAPSILAALASEAASPPVIAASQVQQLLAYARDLNQSLEHLRRVYSELERSYLATIEALAAALDARDSETEGHCQRVTGCTLIIAEAMGITGADLRALHYGAILHDIGKIGIPDAILRKPGELTEEEWALMRRHPELGERIISGIDFLRCAVPVVLYHHERWDGSGYPYGLRGEAIPLGARIFSVADAFDAMISNRPYRHGLSFEQARREIARGAGTQFDPAVVEAFLQAFDRLVSAPFLQSAVTAQRPAHHRGDP